MPEIIEVAVEPRNHGSFQCEPTQIVCLSLDAEGAATAVRGDQHPALVEWKESINLGTLLASGVLG